VKCQYTHVLTKTAKGDHMHQSKQNKHHSAIVISTLSWGVLIACGMNAHAAENYKLRQAPLGSFGGDIATPADKPGFFGTASLSQITIEGIKGPTGAPLTKASPYSNTPLGSVNPAFAPLNAIKVSVADGAVSLTQDQTQLNVAGGYLTESTYANGRIAFVANLPIIKQSRTALITYPSATFSSPIPAVNNYNVMVPAAINGGVATAAANASTKASDNISGIGDTELSAVWIRHTDRLKVAAGVSVFVPTGKYSASRDAALQANPGFGDFYTIRPGVAFTYNLNPNHSHQDWDAGVTIAGRVAYGVNTVNKDTNYKSGNFVYSEAAIVKVSGDFALGMNVFSTQQVTDDTYSGTDATKSINGRYKTLGAGPFISYKIPGQNAGLNFQVNNNFQGKNAINVKSYQLRLIKAF
jgi:hypothetical protein